MEEEHLPLYRSTKKGDCRINYLCSEGIQQWSWIQTGKNDVSISDNAHVVCRSPFNDSLIASGSDDGKVIANTLCSEIILTYRHRHLYGKFLKVSLYGQKRGRSPRTYPLSPNSLVTRGIIISKDQRRKLLKRSPVEKSGMSYSIPQLRTFSPRHLATIL